MWALIGTLKPLKYLKNGESFKWNKTENQFDNIILSINASVFEPFLNTTGLLNFKETEVTKVIRNF